MRNGLIFSLVLMFAVAGGGYWLGQHRAHTAVTTAATAGAQPVTGKSALAGSVKNSGRKVSASASANDAAHKPTLDEVKVKIRALNSYASYRRGQREWARMVDTMNLADIPGALAMFDGKSGNNAQWSMRSSLLARWGEEDPQAALAWANSQPAGNKRDSAVASAVRGWANKDPDAALAWADKLPRGARRNNAIDTVLRAMAVTNPQTAFEKLKDSVPNWRSGYGASYDIFSSWAAIDPSGAAAKATELSGSARIRAFGNIAASYVGQDPQAAMAWANSLGNRSDKQNAMRSALESWAQNDLPGALAWA
ncbi:MAG: hypothetical protein NTZ16_01170, partial [Verrucomicrobia bacterium]|nr:hypothetical protein [Verrucomicrobiota bacterium]